MKPSPALGFLHLLLSATVPPNQRGSDMRILLGIIGAVCFATAVYADVQSKSIPMSFDECQANQANTIAQLNVPASDIEPIVNSSVLTITRVYTADGSVLISCSEPDQKMVVTMSSKGR